LRRTVPAQRGEPEAEHAVRGRERLARLGERVRQRLAHADGLRALAGKQERELHDTVSRELSWRRAPLFAGACAASVHVLAVAPHVAPPPNAAIASLSPGLSRPARTHSSSPIGMLADDVLP